MKFWRRLRRCLFRLKRAEETASSPCLHFRKPQEEMGELQEAMGWGGGLILSGAKTAAIVDSLCRVGLNLIYYDESEREA